MGGPIVFGGHPRHSARRSGHPGGPGRPHLFRWRAHRWSLGWPDGRRSAFWTARRQRGAHRGARCLLTVTAAKRPSPRQTAGRLWPSADRSVGRTHGGHADHQIAAQNSQLSGSASELWPAMITPRDTTELSSTLPSDPLITSLDPDHRMPPSNPEAQHRSRRVRPDAVSENPGRLGAGDPSACDGVDGGHRVRQVDSPSGQAVRAPGMKVARRSVGCSCYGAGGMQPLPPVSQWQAGLSGPPITWAVVSTTTRPAVISPWRKSRKALSLGGLME